MLYAVMFWVSYPVVSSSASSHDFSMAKPSPNHSGNPALTAIGKVVKELRIEAGLSQEALAHDAGIDRSYMGGIERGEHNLTIISLIKICRCLKISFSSLLTRANL